MRLLHRARLRLPPVGGSAMHDARAPDRSVLVIAVAGGVAMAVAMGLGRFFYTPVLPAMMTGLGLGPAEAGWIAAANYVGYLVGAVAAAYGWAEGIERRVALSGLVATAALLLLMAVSSNVALIAAIRFLAGLASAFAMIFTSSIVLSHGLAAGRGSVQSVHFGGVGSGIAISSAMFALVVYSGGDWRAAWLAATALAVAGIVFVARVLPATVMRDGPVRPEPPVRWTPALALLTLSYGGFGFGYVITATFLVAIVRNAGGSVGFEAVAWLVTGLAGAVSVAAWAPVARRIGVVNVYVAGCLVQAVGVAASVLLPSPVGPLLGGLLLGATFIMVTAYGLQAGRALSPQSPRRAFALMTAAFGVGQIVGPLVAGYLADLTGSYAPGSIAAALALVACALLVLPFRADA
jgi:predicted MFS family arabinose efflux permease